MLGACQERVEAPSAPNPPLAPVTRLSPDSLSLSRDLPAGGQHTYRIRVEAGQSVHLVVYQRGLDVLCELSRSSGESLLISDSLSGFWGPEEIFWLAKESDDLRLNVRALALGSTGREGHYELEVLHWERARQDDHLRAEAALRFDAGKRLRRQGSHTLSAQIPHYERAADIWRQLDDSSRLAETLYQLGLARSRKNENREAIELYERAAALFTSIGAVRMQASSIHFAGKAHYALGEIESARERFEEAYRLREALEDPRKQAFTLNYLGMVNVIDGEYEKALAFYEDALKRWRAAGDLANEGMTLHNRGRCYLYLGQFQQALDDMNQVLEIRQGLGDLKGQAKILNGLGLVYESLGNGLKENAEEGAATIDRDLLKKAIDSLKNALEISLKIQDQLGQTVTLSIMGRVHGILKEYNEALSALNKAQESWRDFGYRHYEAFVLYDMGTLLVRMGKSEEALKYLYKALPSIEVKIGRAHV